LGQARNKIQNGRNFRAGLTCPIGFVSKNALQSTKNTSKINLPPRSPSRVLRAFLGITEGNFIQVLIPSQPMRYPPQTLRKLKTLAFFFKSATIL
jgi:hypothetical protein